MKQRQYPTTSLTKDLLSKIDDTRGDIPRSIFVRRIVEDKLLELKENKKNGRRMVNFSRATPPDKATGTPGEHVPNASRSRDTSESDQ